MNAFDHLYVLALVLGLATVISGRYVWLGDADGPAAVAEYDLAAAGSGHVQGGGSEYHSDHHSSHGEKGDKGRKDFYHFDRANKAHSNSEQHSGEYGVDGGHKKSYHDEGGSQHSDHYGDKSEKGHSYHQNGGYKKGHSTKGFHEVHKLDEYKKNKEFFDEDLEEDNYEKHGGYHRVHDSNGGKYYKQGQHDSGFEKERHGKKEHSGKGLFYLGQLGHKGQGGHHEYYRNGEEYGKGTELGAHKVWGPYYGFY